MSYSKLIYDSRPTLQSTPYLNGFTDPQTPTHSQFHQNQYLKEPKFLAAYPPISSTPHRSQHKNIYEDLSKQRRARQYCPLSKQKQMNLVNQCTLKQSQQYAKSIQYTNYLKKIVEGATSQSQIVKLMKCSRSHNIYMPITLKEIGSHSKRKQNRQQLKPSNQSKEYCPIQQNIFDSVQFNFSIDQLSKIEQKEADLFPNKFIEVSNLQSNSYKKQKCQEEIKIIKTSNILIQDINDQKQNQNDEIFKKEENIHSKKQSINLPLSKLRKQRDQNKQNKMYNKMTAVNSNKQCVYTPTKFVNYQQICFVSKSKQKSQKKGQKDQAYYRASCKYGKSDLKRIVEEMETRRSVNKVHNNNIHEASFFPYNQNLQVSDSTKMVNIYDIDFKLQRPSTHQRLRNQENMNVTNANTNTRHKTWISKEDCINTAKTRSKNKRDQRQYQCRQLQSQLKRSGSKSVSKGKLSIVSTSSRVHHR